MSLTILIAGLLHLTNGLFMLAAPERWYFTVPGVPETGPANIHFIRDIGIAFAVSGAALTEAARHRSTLLLVVGAAFPASHALLHIVESMAGHGHAGIVSTLAIAVLAALPFAGLIRRATP